MLITIEFVSYFCVCAPSLEVPKAPKLVPDLVAGNQPKAGGLL